MKNTATIILRLTPAEERVLSRSARDRRVTRAEALRAVLREYGARLAREETMSAHDRLKRYIPARGSGLKGKRSSARNSGRLFAEYLIKKHRALRPQ